MDGRYLGNVALVVLMAVAALFFFPAAHGSFSSTHGPITAVRSLRMRTLLMFAIAAAAAVLTALVRGLMVLGSCRCDLFPAALSACSSSCSPLRC